MPERFAAGHLECQEHFTVAEQLGGTIIVQRSRVMKSTRTTRFTDPSGLSHSWRVNVLRVLLLVTLWLATVSTARAADGLARREWTVDGLVREALVYVPSNARTNARPVVFAFHGHGGTMNHAAADLRPITRTGRRRSWFIRRDSTRRGG